MNQPTSRQIKKFIFSSSGILHVFETGLEFKVDEGIPKGSKFVGWVYNKETNDVCIYVEHESFDEVLDHQFVPECTISMSRIGNPNVL